MVGVATAGAPTQLRSGYWGVWDEPTLRGMADETGGQYFHAGSAGRLREVYRELARIVGWTRAPQEVSALAAVGAFLLMAAAGALRLRFLPLAWGVGTRRPRALVVAVQPLRRDDAGTGLGDGRHRGHAAGSGRRAAGHRGTCGGGGRDARVADPGDEPRAGAARGGGRGRHPGRRGAGLDGLGHRRRRLAQPPRPSGGGGRSVGGRLRQAAP